MDCFLLDALQDKQNERVKPNNDVNGLQCDLAGEASDHSKEHINLHHSLKDVHDSALKAVKDIGGYIHQELSAVAKKHFNTISRPLVRLMAPVLYFKDQLDTLTGVNKPTQDQDIAAWCPTCEQVHSGLGSCNHDPDSIVPDESLVVNIDFTTPYPLELTSPKTHEFGAFPSLNDGETNQNKPQSQSSVSSNEPDIDFPNDLVYQTKFVQKPDSGNEGTGISEAESEIDIRLGNKNSSTSENENNVKPDFKTKHTVNSS